MKLFNGFSKTEKRMMTAALLIALLSLLLFSSDELFYRFIARRSSGAGGVEIGKISYLDNDVRLKSRQTFEWGKAANEQPLHAGDAIYSGKGSTAHVELGKDKTLEVGSDSLIRFREIGGENLGDLQLGDFRFKIDGKVKVAINGVPAVIEGSKSEAVISVDKSGRAKLSLVKGEMKVTSIPQKGAKSKTIAIERKVENDYQELAGAKAEPLPVVPVPVENTSLRNYYLQLYDLYTLADGRLMPRDSTGLTKVKTQFKVAWETNIPSRVEVEFADNSSFTNAQTYQTDAMTFAPPEVYFGANYWRVRSLSSAWSPTQTFEVTSGLHEALPVLRLNTKEAFLIGGQANAKLDWSLDDPEFRAKGFVVERSSDPDFTKATTFSVWKTTDSLPLKFAKAGTYYFRIRAANDKLELTAFSQSVALTITEPPRLQAPILLTREENFAADKKWPVKLSWEKVKSAEAYRIEISHGSETVTKVVQSPNFESKNLPLGSYTFRVAAIDYWNREGEYSNAKSFTVRAPQPKPEPAAISVPILAQKVDPQRAPGSSDKEPIAGLSAAFKLDNLTFFNESYKDSHFQLEGLNMILVSNLSNGTGAQVPLIAGLAARLIHWFNRNHGTEVGLKSKVAGYNASAQGTSPMAFEARYKYRYTFPWRWFSFLREIQVAGIAAMETYRNPNSQNFARSYDMAKIGFNLEFPIGARWDTGGESLIGTSSDSSKKFELSGHLHYNFTRESSFGFGYRLHVFDAATPQSSPVNALPYKEAYGEGYSVFRMSY